MPSAVLAVTIAIVISILSVLLNRNQVLPSRLKETVHDIVIMGSTSNGSNECAPAWFVAHGGPPMIDSYDHPAHSHWRKMGRDMQDAKLKGIVFVSAHWQVEDEDAAAFGKDGGDSGRNVLINVDEGNPLIYDFYGFPKHYYSKTFTSANPAWLNSAVHKQLSSEGFNVAQTRRGIDHGVWVPLYAAFGEQGLAAAGIPLVQVSLPVGTPSPRQDGVHALRLGRALRHLRQQGIAVVGGGQPVHNLGDFRRIRSGVLHQDGVPDYGTTFPLALTAAMHAVESNDAASKEKGLDAEGDPARWAPAKALFARPDYLSAHPTSEHLLPALVVLGAANDDETAVEEFALDEGPLAWNMYRFG